MQRLHFINSYSEISADAPSCIICFRIWVPLLRASIALGCLKDAECLNCFYFNTGKNRLMFSNVRKQSTPEALGYRYALWTPMHWFEVVARQASLLTSLHSMQWVKVPLLLSQGISCPTICHEDDGSIPCEIPCESHWTFIWPTKRGRWTRCISLPTITFQGWLCFHQPEGTPLRVFPPKALWSTQKKKVLQSLSGPTKYRCQQCCLCPALAR